MKTLIFLIYIIFSFSSVYSQNIKKIYKSIKNNDIEDAVIEYTKTDSNSKLNDNEKILYNLGQCLVKSYSNSSAFQPYEAYNIFINTRIVNINEINDYLEKFDLNINKIKSFIYEGVVFEAKKINSESSYEKALEVCKSCVFESELLNLKISSAFKAAKEEMKINSLNNFINKYSDGNLVDLAIDMRDSIVFFNTTKDYSSLIEYTLEYPKSKLNQKIIKELPKILYNEIVKTNDIQKIELFLKSYPNDSNIDDVKKRYKQINFIEVSVNKINGWDNNICIENDFYRFDADFIKVKWNGKYALINNNGISTRFIYDEIKKINSDVAFVTKENKYGVINIQTGKIVVPIEFDALIYYLDDYIRVIKSKKFGIYDKNGNVIAPIIYEDDIYENMRIPSGEGLNDFVGEYILNWSDINEKECKKLFNNGLTLTKLNNKYGYIDESNNIVISHKYSEAKDFVNGLAVVSKGKLKTTFCGENGDLQVLLFGVIDKNDKEIIPFNYHRFMILEKYIIAWDNCYRDYQFKSIFTTNGKLLPSENNYDRIELAKYLFISKYSWLIDDLRILDFKYKGNEYEVGGIVIPFGLKFLDIHNDKTHKFALIDSNLNQITPYKFDSYYSFYTHLKPNIFSDIVNLKIYPLKSNNKIGFINRNGEYIIPFKYDDVELMNGFYFKVSIKNKYGLLNKYGQEVTPIKYDFIENFNKGYSIFLLNDKWGIIDSTGKEVTPIKYEKVFNHFNEGIALAKMNDKYGFIDKMGKELSGFIYDEADYFINGTSIIKKDDKVCLIDKDFNLIKELKINFESIKLYSSTNLELLKDFIKFTTENNIFRVEQNQKVGYINKKTGEEIIPIKYDLIEFDGKIGIAKEGCELKIIRLK